MFDRILNTHLHQKPALKNFNLLSRSYINIDIFRQSLREKCPNTELFLLRIFCIQSDYRKIRTRNNSVFGHFSRSEFVILSLLLLSLKQSFTKVWFISLGVQSIFHIGSGYFIVLMVQLKLIENWRGRSSFLVFTHFKSMKFSLKKHKDFKWQNFPPYTV